MIWNYGGAWAVVARSNNVVVLFMAHGQSIYICIYLIELDMLHQGIQMPIRNGWTTVEAGVDSSCIIEYFVDRWYLGKCGIFSAMLEMT